MTTQFIAEELNITPVNAVHNFPAVASFDYVGPRGMSLKYWTDTGDPTSIEGFNCLVEWTDDHGVLQSMGGVPIAVSIDAASGAQQAFPVQQVEIQDAVIDPARVIRVTLSVSNLNPIIGVGTSKVSWRLTHEPPDHKELLVFT